MRTGQSILVLIIVLVAIICYAEAGDIHHHQEVRVLHIYYIMDKEGQKGNRRAIESSALRLAGEYYSVISRF